MTLLAYGLWPGLAAACLLGLCVGAVTGLPRDRPGFLVLAGLGGALAGLAGLAVAGTVPGTSGVWVESAAGMLAAYLAGCAVGGLGRMVVRRA